MWMIGIMGLLFAMYAALIFFYTRAWKAMPQWTPPNRVVHPLPRLSVIIPARNEENNMLPLLEALSSQSYPKSLFEIIVVNDHSTDGTSRVVKSFISAQTGVTCRLLELQQEDLNSYKKKAIATGIEAATAPWVVCTDADCIPKTNWLLCLGKMIASQDPVFVAAPVNIIPQPTLVNIFQDLDFLTLQGITAASVYKKIHSMCNGANLAYRRDVFYEVEGFKGIDAMASGDDMLLMHKIWMAYPNRVMYLKTQEAIVNTLAAPTWKTFIQQRIRWASKAKNYDDKRILAVLIVVYLFNASFSILLVAGFANPLYWVAFLLFWIGKTTVEWPFIWSVAKFYGKGHRLKYFFFFQPLHVMYTLLAGFLGSFGSYKWKGRKVK